MPKLTIVTREGDEKTVESETGVSVMEIIRDNGVDELLALCGGCCSCATCHVLVEDSFMEKVGQPDEDELDLLEGSTEKSDNSRLSCQIEFTDALDGLVVTIAPED